MNFSPADRYLFVDDLSGPFLSIAQGDVAIATNFRQNFRIDLHSARWLFKTDSNIAVRFTDVKWQYASYILHKYGEDWSSNPGDYEGSLGHGC